MNWFSRKLNLANHFILHSLNIWCCSEQITEDLSPKAEIQLYPEEPVEHLDVPLKYFYKHFNTGSTVLDFFLHFTAILGSPSQGFTVRLEHQVEL